eukprot:IDg19232t1
MTKRAAKTALGSCRSGLLACTLRDRQRQDSREAQLAPRAARNRPEKEPYGRGIMVLCGGDDGYNYTQGGEWASKARDDCESSSATARQNADTGTASLAADNYCIHVLWDGRDAWTARRSERNGTSVMKIRARRFVPRKICACYYPHASSGVAARRHTSKASGGLRSAHLGWA